MKKYFGIKLFLGIAVITSAINVVHEKLYAQTVAQPSVNFAFVPIDITSCVSTMLGALEAVSYTVTFPSSITACVGGMDVSIFFTDLNTSVAQVATSASTVIATKTDYSGVAYVAPIAPCTSAGAVCAATMVFSCYEPSISTVFIGGTGSTCT